MTVFLKWPRWPAHARLAIHDLSSDGRQPMLSLMDVIVVFNGDL